MLKELMIPTTLAVTFAVSPVMATGTDTSGDSMADHDKSQEMKTDASVVRTENEFDELDANQDGTLDEDELNTWGATAAGPDKSQEHTDQVLERYDRNDDHRVSWKELQDGPFESEEKDAMQ